MTSRSLDEVHDAQFDVHGERLEVGAVLAAEVAVPSARSWAPVCRDASSTSS